jgi:DNA-binding transcriptional regulator YdaS (Cro superfamily)
MNQELLNMQIQVFNEEVAIQVATAAGFNSVEEYVNQLIKQAADLEAIRLGIEDARSGRVSPLVDFDTAFREEMAFARRTDV